MDEILLYSTYSQIDSVVRDLYGTSSSIEFKLS